MALRTLAHISSLFFAFRFRGPSSGLSWSTNPGTSSLGSLGEIAEGNRMESISTRRPKCPQTSKPRISNAKTYFQDDGIRPPVEPFRHRDHRTAPDAARCSRLTKRLLSTIAVTGAAAKNRGCEYRGQCQASRSDNGAAV